MNKVYVGIEWTDEVCRFAWHNGESGKIQPLCDEGGRDGISSYLSFCAADGIWELGDAAEQKAGSRGYLVLKEILSFWKSGQVLTIGGESLHPDVVMGHFLRLLTEEIKKRTGTDTLDELVYCLEEVPVEVSDRLHMICKKEGLPSSHFYNRQECFMYYLMSQKQEVWNNYTYLLDFTSKGLDCYEMGILKGYRPTTALAERESVLEEPSAAVLSAGDADRAAADIWFSDFIRDKLDNKVVTSVLLTGEGFDDLSWARQFIRTISYQKGRKVYHVDCFFGMGAAYAAYHIGDEMRLFPYVCVCDGRISTTVSLFIGDAEENRQLILAKEGTNCYEARKSVTVNLTGQSIIHLYMKNTGSSETVRKTLDVAPILSDGNEKNRIRLAIAFDGVNQMLVRAENLDAKDSDFISGNVIWEVFPV